MFCCSFILGIILVSLGDRYLKKLSKVDRTCGTVLMVMGAIALLIGFVEILIMLGYWLFGD